MENQVIVKEKRGVLTLSNVQRFGVGAAVGAALITNANAAGTVDVTAPVATLTTDGSAALIAIGTAMLGLAAIAVLFKWVKAGFFS
ncbi:major capsid protein [Acinetobacter pittii]|uniref:major capsid protein n=1 Tax=Acinetobacter pittii TaxID=48296 RepID=UPI0032607C2D